MSKAFSLDDVAFLVSQRGQTLFRQLQDSGLSYDRLLQMIPRLRKNFTADETSAAIETMRLRELAVVKFGNDARHMLFTADALQQASDPRVRAFRASEWGGHTLDMCSGIGTDAFAFASAGYMVTAFDHDVVRVAMARHNAEVLGLQVDFRVADVYDVRPAAHDSIFYDPARRESNGKRIRNVEHYHPPLSLVQRWTAHRTPIAVKLSPGVDLAQLDAYTGVLRFIAVDNDLKEAELRIVPDADGLRTEAVYLSSEGGVHRYLAEDDPPKRISPPQTWLLEPNSALIRAGYVAHLARDINASFIDSTIAYLSTDSPPDTIWGRAWQVIDWMPFNLKKLRAYLKSHDVGHVVVKKRGSPILPEMLITKLKLKGRAHRTLFLTRYDGQPIVIVAV